MFKSLLRDKILLSLLAGALLVKIFSLNESRVEKFYTYGIYPFVSRVLRILFGWLPFSFGDLLYAVAVVYLLVKVFKFGRQIKNRSLKEYIARVFFRKFLRLILFVYLLFNVLWGLNYNREGIAVQLGLKVQPYTVQDLDTISGLLQQKLNRAALLVDSSKRVALSRNKVLFKEGVGAYAQVEKDLPFLNYTQPSVKPSLFSHIGHFFGFTGYYNPFSGEAQIKTTVPFFLKPFVLTHEIGHQLGYAKENEANFISFLACRSSKESEFRYSAYYEMYRYASRELYRRDTILAKAYKERLHPQVKKDNNELTQYHVRSANLIEPFVSSFYDEYLRMNNQPNGKLTYNEVVAWLIAYQKKYGKESI